MRKLVKTFVPERAHPWLRTVERLTKRFVFKLRGGFGALRAVRPVSTDYGQSRGTCVDRYYIERFLTVHAEDIKGHVLEFGDDSYTRRYGADRVQRIDVMHRVSGNPHATIVADLTADDAELPSDTFDCIICTQVLLYTFDVLKAITNLHRILKPGGVLLVTVPGVAHKIDQHEMEESGDYWRFTSLSMRRMFEAAFDGGSVDVQGHGNVLTSIAFLSGLAVEDLTVSEMDYFDPDYELSITVRAVKQGNIDFITVRSDTVDLTDR